MVIKLTIVCEEFYDTLETATTDESVLNICQLNRIRATPRQAYGLLPVGRRRGKYHYTSGNETAQKRAKSKAEKQREAAHASGYEE
jgi:hypothetical protein